MKLYYAPGACSLAPHIALSEAGLAYTTERVDLRAHTYGQDADYYGVNPKGYVPVLELDNGERLTEAEVILQYIADLKPGTLAPAFGSFERYRLMEWLNFIATEIHKGLAPLWKPTTPEDYKPVVLEGVGRRFDHVAEAIGNKPYLTGDRFTIADAYLFTIANWHRFLKFDVTRWPVIARFLARVAERPAVHAVLVAERLVMEPKKAANA